MEISTAISAVLGGLGLFLVGMWLMTDGLKLAAGHTLRDILSSWTNSRLRALGTGFMITGLVQSSSAITVTTIGFANAGLLNLERAIWVIFGSNVGTTMTGWIVALLGFKLDIEYLALPLIGIGMLIRLSGVNTRRAAIGQAITGFGIFFLGISILKEGFIGQFSDFSLPGIDEAGIQIMVLYMLLGIMLTTLMQSSSAALVITLGAAESGIISLSSAAAVVIGANLGTTTTAILAVWGATSTAKRVAASHVLFNLITACIALIIIAPMLTAVAMLQKTLQLSGEPAMTLALFHTAFNILGVIVMWPLSHRLVSALEKRFITAREIASQPVYLDKTSLQVPAVAMQALLKELERIKKQILDLTKSTISIEVATTQGTTSDIELLATEIGKYVSSLNRLDLPEYIAQSLTTVIQITQQYVLIEDLCKDIADLQIKIDISDEDLLKEINDYKRLCVQLLITIGNAADQEAYNNMDNQLEMIEQEYEKLKFHVLNAGSKGKLGMVSIDAQLQQVNLLRRIARQMVKATHRLQDVKVVSNTETEKDI